MCPTVAAGQRPAEWAGSVWALATFGDWGQLDAGLRETRRLGRGWHGLKQDRIKADCQVSVQVTHRCDGPGPGDVTQWPHSGLQVT